MHPASPQMVAGVVAYRRSKAAATAKLDPPPHHFSDDVAGRDHLGFEEEVETSPMAPELKPMATGVGGNHRLKMPIATATVTASWVALPVSHGGATHRIWKPTL